MSPNITVQFCTGKAPLSVSGKISNAEDVCIKAARYCGIGPVACHLFALWDPSRQVWLCPCYKIGDSDDSLTFQFRLRFKPPTLDQLKIDMEAFNYYFHQLRSDFCAGIIPQAFNEPEKAFGLAVADMLRKILELSLQPNEMKWNYEEYLPSKLHKKYKGKVGKPFAEALRKAYQNCNSDVTYVKEQYIQQFFELAPDYIREDWDVDMDEGDKVCTVTLIVDPYHSKFPGLQMLRQKSRNATHVCAIEDLCFVSRRSDWTVEISRKNGIPQYFRFSGEAEMQSFVSLLDGYYRLMEKWTFNLCKDFPTPSLLLLKSMKCHGPIGKEYAYKKLLNRSPKCQGSFLIRQSSSRYNHYHIDIWPANESATSPITVDIEKSSDEKFFVSDKPKEKFNSLQQLMNHYNKGTNGWNLRHYVPPSEFDKTPLLLCRVDTSKDSLANRVDLGTFPQCFPSDAISYSGEVIPGRYTLVKHGRLRKTDNIVMDVALKTLKEDLVNRHYQDFITFCDKVMFWHSDSLVNILGVVLRNPVSLVMEFLSLGPFDVFLRSHASELESVDLIESANYLARALWYLDEHGYCHGNIRCRNVLVVSHTKNSLKVKLADPGPPTYTEDDVHWIPIECYSNFSLAQNLPSADVWAFGTTLWEIFSYGKNHFEGITPTRAKKLYLQGERLSPPNDCPIEIIKVMNECWLRDPDIRKRPQSIMRDINQLLYEVYNSRRTHSYAEVYSRTLKVPVSESCNGGNQHPSSRSSKLFDAFRLVTSKQNGYGPLSNSSISSYQSTMTEHTTLTEPTEVDNSIKLDCCSMWNQNSSGSGESASPWLIEASQLAFVEQLGQGCFGAVYKAVLNRWSGLKPEVVAVKRINEGVNEMIPSDTGIQDLRREIDIMFLLHHKNIVEVIGYVEEPQIMLVMEYLEQGCLIAYLKMYKDKLPHSQLLKFAMDVAEGMDYLEKNNIVHRDLAARNILVASEDHVKISDFGLAQFTENQYYHVKTQNRGLPLRWYAPEAIKMMKFSSKSDVWSYGVTLWEMFSYGLDPVIGTSSPDSSQIPGAQVVNLIDHLDKGHRLQIPDSCPSEVYRIMMLCWEQDPHNRPDFAQLLTELQSIKDSI